jgi:signal transduction histidine kinase/CheY-like chemotaxis protein
MKKFLLLIFNILIIAFVIVFISNYARHERQIDREIEMNSFKNITFSAELVTTNYLEGEQRTCNSWANYINSRDITMQQAVDYVRTAKTNSKISGHIIKTDTLRGLSTNANPNKPDDFSVSYKELPILHTADELKGEINVTRSYTNPVNGIQSIAFYNIIELLNEKTGLKESYYLMRVVPVSSVEEKWAFPTDKYKNADIAIIDQEGNYIIKGNAFKNSNIFEFYDSYNPKTSPDYIDLKNTLKQTSGTFEMINSKGQKTFNAFTIVNTNKEWYVVSTIPIDDLSSNTIDWALLGIVVFSLLLLMILDIISMLSLNHKLEIAAKAADAANQAKTDFLSTMSHDIRTPMNAIIGLTTITEKSINDPDSVAENLKKISLASNHLLTLINDILDISKVESGKITLTPVSFSIVESAENLVNISQPIVREKDLDFRFRINNIKNEFLFADKLRINQIFINLLSNALKYTPKGGQVCVDMNEEPGNRADTIKLNYTVTDTGIGMSKEFMDKMYEPFVRQTDSRINTIQGTGLGLAITKQMIDLMGGTIDCHSEVGAGTSFKVSIELPVAEIQEAEMVLPPINVLLIDDDEILLETAQDTFKALGAQAEVAISGSEGLSLLEKHIKEEKPFNIIILDWKMPGMNGLELTKKIREKAGNDIPILLVSAYDWSTIEEDAKKAGVNGFISKPLFRSSLYKKITEVLHIHTEQDSQEENNSDIEGMNILIAEDIDINYEIVSTFLEMHGITSVRASNGEEAVTLMESAVEKQYDMIFMDIQMPVMNGLDATRAIRKLANPVARTIPIIAMTADAFSENVAECIEAGMNGHIAKPIDVKVVINEIRRIKEEYGSQRK